MEFDSYVNATVVEVKEQIKALKLSSQKVYDPDKNRFGRIERYDPVEHEVCDVEVLGSDVILGDVPLMELFPHRAFRFRAGQRIVLEGYVGIISKVKRKVKIIRGNGSKLKFHTEEESSGTYDSYLSNGKLPTWWDRISPDNQDMYSTIEEIGYPGSPVVVTPGMELSNESRNFLWTLKDGLKRLKDLILRTESRSYQVVEDPDIVKKVKIQKVKVVWESQIDNISSETHTGNKYIATFAEVLAPLSQELCEVGSHRMYKLKEGRPVKSKTVWLNEKIMADGAPRSITVDEVDNLTVNSEWLKQNKCSIGDDLAVKVIIRKRHVEVRWEDDSLEVLPVSQVVKMIGTDNNAEGSLYEINIETDNESVENGPADGITQSRNEMVEEYNIPWLRNVPRFQKYDFVVDVLRKFPSTNTVYGVLKAINAKEFTAVVDWYSVDEQLNTSLWEDQAVVSIFDLEHMDDLNDPLFRIVWKQKKTLYGSEIVCSRFGLTELGFAAGYVREINQHGQIVVTADSSVWDLWPCQVKRLDHVAYQKDDGNWADYFNAFRTDEAAMKDSLSDFHWQQYKQTTFPHIDMALARGCELFSEYPRLMKLKNAPSNHWYLGYEPDSVSTTGSMDELNDSAIMSVLVNQELKKTLIQIEGVELFFCTYENQPKLASALVVGKKGSIYEDGLFMFDIYFPKEFPNDFPLLHYVCYATNLNPILEDAYSCGPIKPLKFLNMTLEEISVSLGKHHASNIALRDSSNSSLDENEGTKEDENSSEATNRVNQKRTYNLTNFILYIQETLFEVSPEDVMGELFTGSLLKSHVSIYYEFLLGKKLEALANMLSSPYEPWSKFLQLYRERIQILLEVSESILEDRCNSTLQHDGSGDATLVDNSKGSMLFLQRRIEFLRKALNAHGEAMEAQQQQCSESGGVTDPEVQSVNSDAITTEEKTSMGKRNYYSSSSSSSDSELSNKDSSVDGMVIPEVCAYGHDSNPEEDDPESGSQEFNSSLVTAFEEKFADLQLDETTVSYDCQQHEERDVVETDV